VAFNINLLQLTLKNFLDVFKFFKFYLGVKIACLLLELFSFKLNYGKDYLQVVFVVLTALLQTSLQVSDARIKHPHSKSSFRTLCIKNSTDIAEFTFV
jgi:hypothetical protein